MRHFAMTEISEKMENQLVEIEDLKEKIEVKNEVISTKTIEDEYLEMELREKSEIIRELEMELKEANRGCKAAKETIDMLQKDIIKLENPILKLNENRTHLDKKRKPVPKINETKTNTNIRKRYLVVQKKKMIKAHRKAR